MPTVLLLVLMVAATMLLALGGLWGVRRLVSTESLERNNAVAAPLYEVFGGGYALLVAFIVVLILGNFGQAAGNADHEALELADVNRLAGGPNRADEARRTEPG